MERTKQHMLQRLYSREIFGSFDRRRRNILNKAAELFRKVPDRLVFPLHEVIRNMGQQIYLGPSRCGQFLVTYSFTLESTSFHEKYRYRLHWWVYSPGSIAVKVAEVQLFDNQDIRHPLSIGISQWSNVNNKLVVYGYCEDSDLLYENEDAETESRRYYITVTTLPSLNNCKNCKSVAESFDEEDMAANWDRAISMSCLKHGLTIHTILEIAPPFPSPDFMTNLKVNNKIIVNTGNFLHVVAFSNDEQEIKPSFNDTIINEEFEYSIGGKLSSLENSPYICPWKTKSTMVQQSVKKAWLNTITAQAEKAYAFEETDDGCEPRFKWFKKRRIADKMYEFCSDDENMENICPPIKNKRSSSSYKCLAKKRECRLERKENIEEENWSSNKEMLVGDRIENSHLSEHSRNVKLETIRTKTFEGDSKRRQMESHTKCLLPSCNCDNAFIVECDTQGREGIKEKSVPQQNLFDNISYTKDCDSFRKLNEPINSPISSQTSDDCTLSDYELHNKSLNVSIIKPDLSDILADWDVDSCSSLSPNYCLCKNTESQNSNTQSFIENISGTTISPRGLSNNSQRTLEHSWESGGDTGGPSTLSSNRVTSKFSPVLVVLRTRNCNQDEIQKPKEPDDKGKGLTTEEDSNRVKPTKDSELAMKQRMISGCSVQFDRIYIEVDEEIMSTITDIEDDDQGTGYHCALPLSVHGSAYTQLQMISSQKAEKMNIHCERVYQNSLDIEQFCSKVAEIICNYEGLKFWHYRNYDVEIIDVCATNGDILGVLYMHLNVEKMPPRTESSSIENERLYYEVKCVFTWNPMRDRCWLEAYSHLEKVTDIKQVPLAPANKEVIKLRHTLLPFSHTTLGFHPPIRNFLHRFKPSTLGGRRYYVHDSTNRRVIIINFDVIGVTTSLERSTDISNLIGFCLFKRNKK